MPNFNRLDLLRAAESALDNHRKEWGRYHAQKIREYENDLSRWHRQNSDTWSAFQRLIARRLRNSDPITVGDLPGHGRYNLPVFSKTDPSDETYRQPTSLTTLIEALKVLADDKISTSALRDLGVTPDTLRQALSHLAKHNK